ncbi:MAG: 6-carboxytetrahydropterin synthase [Candidatus Zixiibacteriota bacterium]
MYLTLSKRFEISTSVSLARGDRTDAENRHWYGPASASRLGHGYNYVLYVVFHGEVDPATGMMINVSTVKERVNKLLGARYDHKYLNVDTAPFDRIAPTPENIARQLSDEIRPLFLGERACPVAVHVAATPDDAATVYGDGRVERHLFVEFSAARRTNSPHLSDAENDALFGRAASKAGHGHNYRLRVTLSGSVDDDWGAIAPFERTDSAMRSLRELLDHRNLNDEVRALHGKPITTESLARFVLEQVKQTLPVSRVRLWELPHFSVEYVSGARFMMTLEKSFHAAHRLHSKALDETQNHELYGKCNNPAGHGHQYRVEASLVGPYDERTGTMCNLLEFDNGFEQALAPWRYKHLDQEVADFAERPSTGENIVDALWPRVDVAMPGNLQRLRLWETPNNRFTLRRALWSVA